jgi:hypothetical protein
MKYHIVIRYLGNTSVHVHGPFPSYAEAYAWSLHNYPDHSKQVIPLGEDVDLTKTGLVSKK